MWEDIQLSICPLSEKNIKTVLPACKIQTPSIVVVLFNISYLRYISILSNVFKAY